MENLKNLEKIAKIFQPQNIITSEEIDQVLKGIMEILASYKKGTDAINEETKAVVNILLDKVVQSNKQTIDRAETVLDDRMNDLESILKDVKQMITDVEVLASEVKDGKDADEEKIVEDVVSRIKLEPTIVTLSAEEVRDRLASLKDDARLDKSAIKGLDKILQQSDLDYAIATLQQQTSFLINRGGLKTVSHDATLSGDGTPENPLKVESTSGLTLETNSTPNGDQTLLNLVAGTNITLTDNGTGTVTIDATGGSGSPGGSDTQLQYNNAGAFGGISGATSNGTEVTLNAPSLTTSLTANYATASTIAIFDSSKNLITASTATYPSLTELSYVKGVTSSIQTQLNSKGSGTVTAVSVASANGFAGSSSGGATPALTLTTTVTGIVKGNGTALSAAVANTDYQVPITLTTTGSSGAATFNGTTLNIPQYSGGGTPGGSTGQLQFNNSGAFGGTALLYDNSFGTSTIYIPNQSSANTDADFIAINGGKGKGTGLGSQIQLKAGADETNTNTGGLLTMTGGNPSTNVGGSATFQGGTGSTTGGAVRLTAGNGTTTGGDVIITPGNGGSTGKITLTDAGTSFKANLITSSLTADRNFTFPDATGTLTALGNSSTGSGSIVLATAPTIATSLTASYATASTIAIFDASKNLISADTATYPSLTELSYVKGVTSSIQTQLNAKGTGSVTSVGGSFTGGLISVGGSPVTTTGTLAFTVAGTSGGIPYFSSASTWASSAALTANALVIGGGAGAAPATTTTGTGVLTALGVNVGSAGAFVTFNGALGTPSSGTVTNLTGTASININGTVGATTPTTGAFTTLSASSTLTASTTIELGHASDTTLSRASAGQVNIEGVQVLTASNSVTVTGKSISASQITTGTFGTGEYTMDTRLTVPQILNTPATITVTSNAGTVTRANRINNFTNSSAATMTITMSTTGATDGDMVMVVILDASAVAQTITWVNTENSTVTAPTTSNGSTTLPLTVGFKWNAGTSKWRCIGSC